MIYVLLILLLSVFAVTAKYSLKNLHIIQLEGYKNSQYIGWLKKNYINKFKRYFLFSVFIFITFILINLFFPVKNLFLIFAGIIIVYNLYDIISTKKQQYKKQLVFTYRMIRLTITLTFVTLLELLIIYYAYLIKEYEFAIGLSLLLILIIPVNLLLSNLVNSPLEHLIQLGYKSSARKKLLKNKHLNIIGITGSYGKTSTKNFLNSILSTKFNVLMTPSSYNTPMGLCKIIRGNLSENHDVFLAEMGARYPKDIEEICKFVNPNIGILTSIGEQHLETFKSIENVSKTKFELIESLPEDGLAVFNADNEESLKLISKSKVKTLTFGIENKNADITASDISFSNKGTNFNINIKDYSTINCTTKVLGEHNIYNILASVCVAVELNLSQEQIKTGIENIQSVEHRLQIVPTDNNLTVIDDAFNSNPIGSKMALDVIKNFSGNKIIVTPGMVELGEKEFEYNKEFGKNIGKTCDYAILIGPERSKPIVEGLKEENFSETKTIIVDNLDQATQKLGNIARAGDVVLFENDLPDNYN